LNNKKYEDTWFSANITIDRPGYNVPYGSGSLGDKTIHDEFRLKVDLLITLEK
jgi:hypothetical protein